MAAGLVKRYREAGEAPPKVIYVDRDCCSQHGPCRVKAMFAGWDELQVRLDIWHFMRRFAAGVTTEAHPLYGIFMARLSTCIFEWDPEDVAALRRAKEGELAARSVGNISEEAVTTRITRRELALHCRRRTRGVEETNRLIGSLISLFDSASGKDTLGVPLLDHERIQQIWMEQQKHLGCIQDPEDFQLYIKTGTLKKGNVELCCYRCARGSTSLESFHLHLNRFIPGIAYICVISFRPLFFSICLALFYRYFISYVVNIFYKCHIPLCVFHLQEPVPVMRISRRIFWKG